MLNSTLSDGGTVVSKAWPFDCKAKVLTRRSASRPTARRPLRCWRPAMAAGLSLSHCARRSGPMPRLTDPFHTAGSEYCNPARTCRPSLQAARCQRVSELCNSGTQEIDASGSASV